MKRIAVPLAALTAVLLLLAQLGGLLPWWALVTQIALAQTPQVTEQQSRASEIALAYDTIARRTAELRGLPLLHEVTRTVLSPEQYRQHLLDELNQEDSLRQIENSRRLMVALGLLAPDVDLYQLEVEFRTGVVLGQYDPETKELYVITGRDPLGPMERVTFAHEMVHALQDQHYGIRTLMPKNSDNSDRDLAVSALLEGDALIMEEIFQQQAMTRAERDEKQRQERSLGSNLNLDRLPLVVVEETYFPYVAGPRFIINVVGADALREVLNTGTGYGPQVERLFQNPPRSSAQILHPEKYLNNVEPIPVQFPDLAAALGEGWQQLRKDVLGEIDHRILIQQYSNRETGEQAARGWAGDAFALLGNGSEVAVVVRSHWDTPADATKWFEAYAKLMRSRYGGRLEVVDQRPDRIAWRTPDGGQVLRLSGTTTDLTIAPSLDQAVTLERSLSGAQAGPVSLPTVRLN
ncbi:MAG: hypothetical protein IRZ14_09640 [Chloroflexi bacterium]|nr:hypothetical protein [Chloroflexota bacterium]